MLCGFFCPDTLHFLTAPIIKLLETIEYIDIDPD